MGQKGTEKDRIVGKNIIEGRRTDRNRRRQTETDGDRRRRTETDGDGRRRTETDGDGRRMFKNKFYVTNIQDTRRRERADVQ